MREVYTQRRKAVTAALAGNPKVDILEPEGGFFTMLDVSRTGRTSTRYAAIYFTSTESPSFTGARTAKAAKVRSESHSRVAEHSERGLEIASRRACRRYEPRFDRRLVTARREPMFAGGRAASKGA